MHSALHSPLYPLTRIKAVRVYLGTCRRDTEPCLLEGGSEVLDDFNIYRSMRRGSESRATEVGIDSRVIDLINRWKTAEGNRKSFGSMRDYYLELVLIKKRLTKYSASL